MRLCAINFVCSRNNLIVFCLFNKTNLTRKIEFDVEMFLVKTFFSLFIWLYFLLFSLCHIFSLAARFSLTLTLKIEKPDGTSDGTSDFNKRFFPLFHFLFVIFRKSIPTFPSFLHHVTSLATRWFLVDGQMHGELKIALFGSESFDRQSFTNLLTMWTGENTWCQPSLLYHKPHRRRANFPTRLHRHLWKPQITFHRCPPFLLKSVRYPGHIDQEFQLS